MRKPTSYIFTLFIFISFQVQAKRWGLAKQYSIPSIHDSHLMLGRAEKSELDPKSIKVLVWNLLKAERKDWSRDFKMMAKANDLLLLQEGYLNNKMEDTFFDLKDFRFDFGVSFLYNKDNKTPTGSILGANVDPIESGLLRTTDYEPFIKTPKTITYGYFPITGMNENVLVLTIHGLNFTKHKPFENQINDALSVIDQHQGPIIFAGDFNTRTKKRMRFLRSNMLKRGFKEIAYNNDKRMKVLGHYLDHAFVKKMLVRKARVLAHVKSSDHKPLEIELVVDKK
jgi:endonuclease/exonuclease/phosphatase (EEP) superfamily protein YafD